MLVVVNLLLVLILVYLFPPIYQCVSECNPGVSCSIIFKLNSNHRLLRKLIKITKCQLIKLILLLTYAVMLLRNFNTTYCNTVNCVLLSLSINKVFA